MFKATSRFSSAPGIFFPGHWLSIPFHHTLVWGMASWRQKCHNCCCANALPILSTVGFAGSEVCIRACKCCQKLLAAAKRERRLQSSFVASWNSAFFCQPGWKLWFNGQLQLRLNPCMPSSMFFLNCMGAFKGKSMVTLSHQSNLHLDFQRCFKSTHSFEIGMVKNESNAIRMNRMTFHEGTVPFRKLTWQGKHSPKDSIEVLQGGPLPVINGVITSINGLINGHWSYNPTYGSYNPIYNW